MTVAQTMIMVGVLILSQDLTPKTRMLTGLAVGLWGLIFSVIF